MGFRDLVGQICKSLTIEIEQAVAHEERVGLGRKDEWEFFRIGAQFGSENFRGFICAVGQVGIDNNRDII